jgi:hypothetical protein
MIVRNLTAPWSLCGLVRRGTAFVFDFIKRDLVLWLAALVLAVALMALTANFAFDRLSAAVN